MRKILKIIFAVLIITIGLLIMTYPTISSLWNNYRNSKLETKYAEKIESNKDIIEDAYKQALEYNKNLKTHVVTNQQNTPDSNYESILNIMGDNIIGFIKIPDIGVSYPIYHYSTDDVLEDGIGHIYGSSFPIEGDKVHSLITGHRGLASNKFFSDLDKIEIGDIFYITVLNKTFKYEVYDIETVLPKDVDNIQLEDNKNICTLVTCTPYAVNTHRLLVHANFIEEVKEPEQISTIDVVANTINMTNVYIICVIISICIIYIIITKVRKKYKK